MFDHKRVSFLENSLVLAFTEKIFKAHITKRKAVTF